MIDAEFELLEDLSEEETWTKPSYLYGDLYGDSISVDDSFMTKRKFRRARLLGDEPIFLPLMVR